jgi:hypothetical protein
MRHNKFATPVNIYAAVVVVAILLVASLVISAGSPASAAPQLQQSGGAGSTVSVVQGGNTAAVTAGGALKVDASATTQPVSGTVTANQGGTWNVTVNAALPAGTNNIGLVTVIPKTGCGTTYVDSGAITVPTTSTAVTSFTATSCIEKIFVSNVTSSAVTLVVTDNQGTPVTYITGFSVPANSNMLLDMGGIKFSSGVKWSAGTSSALVGQVVGYQ